MKKKVYCKDCKHYRSIGKICSTFKILECPIRGKYKHIIKFAAGFKNNFFDCEDYKKKWWKFWIKEK